MKISFFFGHDDHELTLSDLFGNRDELILIFSMGKGCPYCTLWADGYNGLVPHLENMAAFVVASPDSPEIQKEYSLSRNWTFKMVSHSNADFCKELGFYADHSYQPGVATLTKDEDGMVLLRAKTYFGPGDNFCIMWNFIDMLPESEKEWVPKYKY